MIDDSATCSHSERDGRFRRNWGRRTTPEGRLAIVVDDGLATGATMLAALHSVRAKQPERLVCAISVASADGLEAVRPYADEVVCLATPPTFHAVAQFYREFSQVEDDEVVKLLTGTPTGRSAGGQRRAGAG